MRVLFQTPAFAGEVIALQTRTKTAAVPAEEGAEPEVIRRGKAQAEGEEGEE